MLEGEDVDASAFLLLTLDALASLGAHIATVSASTISATFEQCLHSSSYECAAGFVMLLLIRLVVNPKWCSVWSAVLVKLTQDRCIG